MTDSILMRCDRCGSTRFEFPENPLPDDVVTCVACGISKPYGERESAALHIRDLKGPTARELAGEAANLVYSLGRRVLLNVRP
jgi:hypothetical protein